MSWGYGVFLRLLCLAAGYLFGCFLTAEVVARCTAGESARQIGSGNPGMANIMTHLGKRAGLLVLACIVAGLFGVLIGIPALRLTTRGVIDVIKQQYI